jgi:uncharacterized repeat protein (TIGR01451 family)
MKKFKIIFAFLGVITAKNFSYSQYVTIPSGGFANYLQYAYPGSMVGNTLDTTFAAITNATIVNIPTSYNVTNLEGIQYFDNLDILTVNYHPLASIPFLPQNLIELNAAYCNLTTINNFPTSLQKIEISSNLNLSNIPSLPVGLTSYYRSVTPNLPIDISLPTSLQIYYVGQCNVLNLPPLPAGLLNLSIGSNYGINIPILPAGLETLGIDNLNLTELPPIPNTLTYLWALNNNFTTLDLFPPNLEILYLNSCPNLTSIENLPNSLQQLFAPNCSISYIDNLPNSIGYLDLVGNQLISLPNLPTSAMTINLQNNNLTSLPSFPPVIYELFLSNNQLSCLPFLPTTIYSINLDNNDFTCLPNILPAMSAIYQSFPLCEANDPLNNPFGCLGATGIEGYAFQDLNMNCIREGNDNPMKNVPVNVFDNTGNLISSASTFTNGRYFFPLDAGQYIVEIDTTNKPYTVDCIFPGSDSAVTLNVGNPLVGNVNFGIKCKPGFDIGAQSINTIGIVFPGQVHTLNSIVGDLSNFYNLNCAEGVSGTVSVSVNGPVTFQNPASGSMTPTISGNTYTYSVANFGSINPDLDFRLDFETDTTAVAGNQICVTVNVTPTSGDNQPSNNNYTYCYEVVNSYDPNNKVVYPSTIAPDFDGYLTYRINFQNTGNAPAFNIRLEDTLSTMLDLSTFAVIDYSHAMHYHLSNRKLTVYYPNIMLVDSNTSFPESIGHITYKIKLLPGFSDGNLVENTAYIFFDFNSPIVTNVATTSVVQESLGFAELDAENVSIYPNPTSGFLYLSSKNEIQTIEIVDQQGRIVDFEKKKDMTKINLSHLESGIYFIKIATNEKEDIFKVNKF